MTLRKVTIDNSVKYIPKSEQTRDFKPKTMKNNSLSRKQGKIISRNNKKFVKAFVAGRFGILK